MTAAISASLIRTLKRQRLKTMALVNQRRLTPVVQQGWVRAVSSHTLVPGDIVVVQRGKAMCDMVLLQGACLVMESTLSGEVIHCHLGSGGRVPVCLPQSVSACVPMSVCMCLQLCVAVSVAVLVHVNAWEALKVC